MRRILPLFLLMLLLAIPAAAQEFNCRVTVDKTQIQGNQYDHLNELQRRIEEYINQKAWTDDTWLEEERIDCSIQVNVLNALSMTSFNANVVVSTRRPIYAVTQNSPVMNILDKNWNFDYTSGARMDFNLEQYDPLTSVLDFYVFVMLGYDYDTFSPMGGTPYFETARRIMQRAESRSAPGWVDPGDDQTRSNLITQILDPRFRRLRQAYFDYHFNGLDRFVRENDIARENILGVLSEMEKLRDEVSRSYAQDIFFSSKYQELTGVFEKSPFSSEAYQILTSIDPAHMSEYNKLTQ